MELDTYIPLAVAIVLGLGFCILFSALSTLIGPKRETRAKHLPVECGSDPIGSPRGKYSVSFYQVALLFLVFDIEAAFMYPWTILFKDLSISPVGTTSLFGFTEMFVFVCILVVALAYVWRKKAIGWD